MSNIIKLHFVARPETEVVRRQCRGQEVAFSVTRRAHARKPRCSENGTLEERAARKCSGANMHKVVFRSTTMILASSPDERARDVGLDLDKAQTKLRRIREQMERDREWAAARDTMMSLVEAKLDAAIAAVQSGADR
jgi:hypothetical protein